MLDILSRYALIDRAGHFVGNRVEMLGNLFDVFNIADDLDLVAELYGIVDFDEEHVHTDVANNRIRFAANINITAAVLADYAVCVTDWDDGNALRAIDFVGAVIAERAVGNFIDLDNFTDEPKGALEIYAWIVD